MQASFSKAAKNYTTGLIAAATGMFSTAALADPDLSPWQDPAGFNAGLVPDIQLDTTDIIDGEPVTVSIEVFNRGDSVANGPVQVTLQGNNSNIITDENDDIKELADIAPGSSSTISFVWTPDVNQNVTQLIARVDQSNAIIESNESNNATLRNVSVEPSGPPLYSCENIQIEVPPSREAVFSAFDNIRSFRDFIMALQLLIENLTHEIDIATELEDENGVNVDGAIAPPLALDAAFNRDAGQSAANSTITPTGNPAEYAVEINSRTLALTGGATIDFSGRSSAPDVYEAQNCDFTYTVTSP